MRTCRGGVRRLRMVAAFASLVFAGGCAGLPRDQDGWTDRVRAAGELPVGVSHEGGAAMAGLEEREKRLVEQVARRLGVRVAWRQGNAHELLQDLEERTLPLVAATITADSPFGKTVGLSQPYLSNGPRKKDYCLAVAPGENRLLLLIDKVIAEERRREEKEGRP